MITLSPLFFFNVIMFIFIKEAVIFSSILSLDKPSVMLLSVFPFFTLFLIKNSSNSLVSFSHPNIFMYLIMFFLFFFFCCQSFFFFMFFLEMTSLLMVYSVFDLSKSSDKSSSVIFMFLINMVGSIPFLIFCVLSSSIQMNFLGFMFLYNYSFFLTICCVIMMLSKVPIFLMHFWLTKAHVSAYSICSMLLASLMIKLGTMGLFKFSFFNLYCYLKFIPLSIPFSLFSCIFISLSMFRFFDIKMMVACSSILHMAMIIPMSFMMNSSSFLSSFFMNCGHGLVSCYLFFLVSLGYELNQNRSVNSNKSCNSFDYTFTLIFSVLIFFNLGLPPFVSFCSELLICFFLIDVSYLSMVFFSLIMFMSVLFSIFMITISFFGKKNILQMFKIDSSFSWIFTNFMFFMLMTPFFMS